MVSVKNLSFQRKSLIAFTMVTVIAVFFAISSSVFAYCSPQCVTYARQLSGINHCYVGTNGTALDWYDCESGKGHSSSAGNSPKAGRVVILKIGSTGHAIYINSVGDGDNGKYSIKISQSNANGRCGIENKIKATYDKKKKTLKYKGGVLEGKTYSVKGFITK
jgi:hypothetical protein